TNDEVADGKGVYVWSGSAWYLMTAFPVSVLLDPDAVTYGTIGLQEPLMLVLKPDQVQHKSVVWDSSNKAVATVDQTGVVTTLSNGSTTITATTADGQVATCVVGVDNGCSDGIFAADLCWSTESKTVTNAQIACEEGWRVPTVDELITAVGLQQLGLINANYWSGDVRLVNTEDGGCESWNRYAVGGGDAAIYDVPVIIATPGTAGVYGWGAPDYVLVCKNETPGNWLGVCDATRIGASGYKKVAYGQCNAPTNIIRVNYVCTVLQSPSSCGNTASNTTSILKCVKSI
ncbi:MAG: Ig-like domain-containing protein, partial [Candidatus Symbiothrix sp.]|nr:Ig-like domain-containing protein [Candidatus Symbiothrix sp.]